MTLDELERLSTTASSMAEYDACLDAIPALVEVVRSLMKVVQAAREVAAFTGHNPLCQLIADRTACSEANETCPGPDTHGPCDCGHDALRAALAPFTDAAE